MLVFVGELGFDSEWLLTPAIRSKQALMIDAAIVLIMGTLFHNLSGLCFDWRPKKPHPIILGSFRARDSAG